MLVGAPVRLLGCLVMKLVYVAVDPYSKKITSETVRFINTLIEIGCKVAWRYRGGVVMLVFLVILESLTGVLLKRTKMTKRAKRAKRTKVTNINNKTIIYRGGVKKTTYTSSPAISELIVSSIGLDRQV